MPAPLAPAHKTPCPILDLKHARFGCIRLNPGGAAMDLGWREFSFEQPMIMRGSALPAQSSSSGVEMPNLAAVSWSRRPSSFGLIQLPRIA